MKKWYQSRTIWLNGLAFIASVSTVFGVDLGLTEAVRVEIVGGIMAVLTGINLGLRGVTSKGLT